MKIEDFKNARVTVMGLGLYKQGSGMGATKWLIRHEAQTIITDLKTEEELKESVDEVMQWYERYKEQYPDRNIYKPIFVLGEHRDEDFTDVDFVVQNPGVPKESKFVLLARDNKVPILTDISIFFQFCPWPIMAVTGTKGKTTTTTLLGEIFKAANPGTVVGGNIKVSPLEYLDILLEEDEVPVLLELSSWQLESLVDFKMSPHIALLTNIYPDHLNRYGGSYEKYQESKAIIFNYQTEADIAVVNRGKPESRKIGASVPSKRYWFQIEEFPEENGSFVRGGMIIWRNGGEEAEILPASEVGLKGEHNLENVLGAACFALAGKVSAEIVRQVLREFDSVPDRQEIVRRHLGITYVNDTTATTPDATIAALKRFAQGKNIVLLAGGNTKELSFEKLGQVIGETCKHVILMAGVATPEIAAAITGGIPATEVKSMPEAVQKASQIAEDGDVVLMSPACSSFGMFRNEFDRGDQFKEEVSNL